MRKCPGGYAKEVFPTRFSFFFSFSTVTNCFFIHLIIVETRRRLFTKEIVISSAIVGVVVVVPWWLDCRIREFIA
jgi:4-amino-4-deoxy-L-arabinose transferase-like glycosyltransferase